MVRILGAVALAGGLAFGQMATAGAVGGPKYRGTSVNAYDTDSYTISFHGGQTARVLLKGDGDTDVDLYIYDQNGHLVASDADGSDTCAVEFHPLWTGPFVIRVVNRGGVYNRYTIVTN